MHGGRGYRISARLNMLLLLVVAAVVAGFGALDYAAQARWQREQTERLLAAIEARLSVGLPEALWNYDQEQIGKILRAEFASPAVDAIVLRNGSKWLGGAARDAKGRPIEIDDKVKLVQAQRSFELRMPNQGVAATVGRATIHYNREDMDQVLRERLYMSATQAIVLSIVIVAAMSLISRRLVLKPLERIGAAMEDIAHGDADLTRRLPYFAGIEFKQVAAGFNVFVERIQTMIADVQRHASACAEATALIAEENKSLAARTEVQAKGLQRTAGAVEQLTDAVSRNTESATLADTLTRDSQSLVNAGASMMREVVETMRELNDQSNRMADIVGTIDSIAFQTNILALNASVEAARAGEHGRGFAVVASEVRSLAQRSAESAREIRALIDESVLRIENSSAQVARAGQSMDDIVESIRRLGEIVASIASASRQQAGGVGLVSESVHEIDKSTRSNAGFVETTAASTAAVRTQVTALVKLVEGFKVGEVNRPTAGTYDEPVTSGETP